MAYSEDGYKLAVELVIPHILAALDSMKPGTRAKITEAVARQTSEGLDAGGGEDLRDALSIAADWDTHPVREERPAPPEPQPSHEETMADRERWLVDPEYAPATLEGQAAARLSSKMLVQLMRELEGRLKTRTWSTM